MSDPVRVLVVDDSALMRKLIPQIIERDSTIHVVGTANLSAHSARVIVTQGTSMTRLGEAHGEGTVEWRLGVYLDKLLLVDQGHLFRCYLQHQLRLRLPGIIWSKSRLAIIQTHRVCTP